MPLASVNKVTGNYINNLRGIMQISGSMQAVQGTGIMDNCIIFHARQVAVQASERMIENHRDLKASIFGLAQQNYINFATVCVICLSHLDNSVVNMFVT